MKKLLLVSLILVMPFAARADHEVCAAVVPPPPGCVHDNNDDDSNNDKVFIGAALVLGGYYLFSQKDADVESRYNLVSGLNLFRTGKFEINTLALPAYNTRLLEDPALNETHFNLLTFRYRFER